MADERRRAAWEELNITKDELNRIGNALKNEEFRKLLLEYADEINDPENKKIYEEEIKLLEKERGVDCTFINPIPGYVIKTSIDGERKAFVNVCKNENVGKPSSAASSNAAGKRGLSWSLPYTQAPPRDDLDKKCKRCTVFDVVFHPDTLRLAQNNVPFRDMLNETALDAVEKNYSVKLDRKNLKFPKMDFKGTTQPTVIRKKSANPPCNLEDASGSSFPYPYPYPSEDLKTEEKLQTSGNVEKSAPKEQVREDNDTPYTTPRHTIKYRSSVDIQDFANDRDSKINAAIPKELVVTIHLPLLSSTADVILDVNEKWVHLTSTKIAKYFLHLPLPYAISEELGNAKFDKSERKLVLTLPVKRTNKTVSDLSRDDSGVESDPGIRTPESEEDEKGDRAPLIQVVGMSEPNQVDNFVRTMGTLSLESFLNPDYHYLLPPFTCNVVDNILAFTLHVKNVEPDSVKHTFLVNNNGLQMCFSSLGSGFFPLHYGFYVELSTLFTVSENDVSIETWDNNVIVQLVLNPCDSLLTSYCIGTNKESATNHDLPEPAAIGQKLIAVQEESADDDADITDLEVHVTKSIEEDVLIEITRKENERNFEEDCKIKEALPGPQSKSLPKKQMSLDVEKARSYSESSSDELNPSPAKRGILKCRSVNRSLSESNAEDYCYSPSLDSFPRSFGSEGCIPEEESEESQGSKKTVRFNEVVSKKTFRTNSSIFGQRKKNQRKVRNKKRAQERRASESENSEGELEKIKQTTKSTNKTQEKGKEAAGFSDKLSSSSGSGDEACDSTDMPESYEKPNDFKNATMKTLPTPSTSTKRSKRRKKNRKQVQNPDNLGILQLGFKNEMLFDLDM